LHYQKNTRFQNPTDITLQQKKREHHARTIDFFKSAFFTDKSFSEALIPTSINPKYYKRLFIELQIASTIRSQNMLCTQIVLNVKTKNNLCTQHVLRAS